MSVTYLPQPLRREVVERAEERCEYCRTHQNNTAFGCEVDHILSEKHMGRTESQNLALSYFFATAIRAATSAPSVQRKTRKSSAFFNPRIDVWAEHFALDAEQRMIPLTDIGRVTARILGFNAENSLLERQALDEEE